MSYEFIHLSRIWSIIVFQLKDPIRRKIIFSFLLPQKIRSGFITICSKGQNPGGAADIEIVLVIPKVSLDCSPRDQHALAIAALRQNGRVQHKRTVFTPQPYMLPMGATTDLKLSKIGIGLTVMNKPRLGLPTHKGLGLGTMTLTQW